MEEDRGGARRSRLAAFCVLAAAMLAPGGPAMAQAPHCQLDSHDEARLLPPAERVAWLTQELAACADPEIQALSYYSRGKAYIELREYEFAVADLTQSIALQPTDVFYDYTARAFAYLQLGEEEQAIADSTVALETEPWFAMAYNTRGVAQCNLHRVQDGTADILTAIDLDRAYAQTWQEFLRKAGYYDGLIGDGFNAASKAALAQWCKTHRIAPGPIFN